jgi:hypothetical protein
MAKVVTQKPELVLVDLGRRFAPPTSKATAMRHARSGKWPTVVINGTKYLRLEWIEELIGRELTLDEINAAIEAKSRDDEAFAVQLRRKTGSQKADAEFLKAKAQHMREVHAARKQHQHTDTHDAEATREGAPASEIEGPPQDASAK